ncbi:maltodextrin phosphorylase [Methyloprofundus sedimenti]|uniref:Alpha-1,4 glucan phosphorylase n=1 Tax=Methyloprofundus sedimenti TaxID=1420851 RepID=A0A1V8M221_9GAMM|nr:glycogen/starch/alpha-glucan phosphorylase [Methyloprofundus sedimenti]OQK15595.1 maltodextrin phosphorylase [Methyloprofundus sedimenti]
MPVSNLKLTTIEVKRSFFRNLANIQGQFPALASSHDYYMALSYTVRDMLMARWVSTASEYTEKHSRTVAYLSAEFLMGPHLAINLLNLQVTDVVRQAMSELGLNLDELIKEEPEPGLGNGGLGRLAACFLDSMATLEIPSVGYGIRYEFGIFEQIIADGWQVEKTDKWLMKGNPWEIVRPDWAVEVKFGGYTERYEAENGTFIVHWVPGWQVKGVPYDTPILGYKNNTANTLRLWQAVAPESFNFSRFNEGDYYGAVEEKVASENLTKVLYPNDGPLQGKQLRLQQQYFFVSCSLQDMLRIMKTQKVHLDHFHEKFAVQLNDTHPAVAIAELMRLLIDEHKLEWDISWRVTQRTFSYTNHTLLPEALECWSIDLFGRLLPRLLEIIYEINDRFLEQIRPQCLLDSELIARMSLLGEQGDRQILRMAHLACVGSHAINGVAALHTELLKTDVLADFYSFWPQKFSNKTNGVTPRRWIALSNPRLSRVITEVIGDQWLSDLSQLKKLETKANNSTFQEKWYQAKLLNKHDFALILHDRTGVSVDPDSIFDVQVKRIHEYKRQHLNVLYIIALYQRLKSDPQFDIHPRTFIFAGKAAPGYHLAKLIIKLINSVGDMLNRDPTTRDKLKVVFLPNFNVSNGQLIYPVADLSEQISTAGKEASGTGNMKFAMNGALTIGTLDGANIEIREEVGAENFFLFGNTAEQVKQLSNSGYSPQEYYQNDSILKEAIDLIRSGFFSHGDPETFRDLTNNLIYSDPFQVLADFNAYYQCQEEVDAVYRDKSRWCRMSILNSARSGKFSSDRTISEYCQDIWKVEPVQIQTPDIDPFKLG